MPKLIEHISNHEKLKGSEQCEPNIDSGFFSGNNLIVSDEIKGFCCERGSEILQDASESNLCDKFITLKIKSSNNKDKIRCNYSDSNFWKEYFQQDEDGDTFFHLTILEGFEEIVLALIRMIPDPQLLNIPNDDAQTPLHLAVSLGYYKIARWLIVAGAKAWLRNMRGDSPLHIAARNGDLMCCQAITDPVKDYERITLAVGYSQKINHHRVNLEEWNYEGQTCVHVAAMEGHVDVLRHLVSHGADINAREGRQGYTALHYAVARGDERLTDFLLSECTNLNAKVTSYGGNNVLQLELSIPSTIVEALKSRGVSEIPNLSF